MGLHELVREFMWVAPNLLWLHPYLVTGLGVMCASPYILVDFLYDRIFIIWWQTTYSVHYWQLIVSADTHFGLIYGQTFPSMYIQWINSKCSIVMLTNVRNRPQLWHRMVKAHYLTECYSISKSIAICEPDDFNVKLNKLYFFSFISFRLIRRFKCTKSLNYSVDFEDG